MKFLEQLNTRLEVPPTDPDTSMLLETQVSDAHYNAYVQFVGRLDALPQAELQVHELKDHLGRVRPLRSWPTRSTRAVASKNWDNYNKRIQDKTDPGETKDVDPCKDTDQYIIQQFNDCVKTNSRGGDKAKAVKHCKDQVSKLGDAIDAECEKNTAGEGELADPFTRTLFNTLNKPE